MPLYINQIEVDISDKFAIPLTYEISDITDISKRKGNSSKTITLPGTQKNVQLMSQIFTTSFTDKLQGGSPLVMNIDPSVKTPAEYYDDESNVLIFKGLCQVLECRLSNEMWEFDVLLFSEQIDFMANLSKIKLNELDLTEYNHDWTRANIENSWTGTIKKNAANYSNISGSNWLGEGYYYGLIEHGYERPQIDSFPVDTIPPQVFIKTLVDKMFTEAGYTYDSDFFLSQTFKKLLLPFHGGKLPSIDQVFSTANSVETDIDNPTASSGILETTQSMFNTLPLSPNYFTFLYNQPVNTPLDVQSGTVVDPGGQVGSNAPLTFTASNEGYYTIDFSGTLDIDLTLSPVNGSGTYSTGFGGSAFLYTYIDGALWNSTLVNTFTTTGSSLTYSASPSVAVTLTPYLYSSQVVTFEIYYINTWSATFLEDTAGSPTTTGCTIDTLLTANTLELDITLDVQQVLAGNPLNLKYFMPDMKCDVFFKGLVNMFNLFIKTDDDTDKKLKIEPLNDFYSGSNNATVWTELVDPSKTITVKPTVNLAKKNYILEFKPDKDYWSLRYEDDTNRKYGDYVVSSNSEFAKGDQKVTLPFSQKPLVQIDGTDLIIPHNYTVKTSNNGLSEVVPKKATPYIVQIKDGNPGTMQTGSWYLIDELLSSHAKTSYPYVGHLDDINTPSFDLMFSVPSFVFYTGVSLQVSTTNNLYVYHERFIKQIISRNGKLLTASIKLTPSHINTLDMGRLINIDGVVYRLQKISDYESRNDDSTKCEFVRLVEAEDFNTNTITEADENLQEYGDPYEIPTLGAVKLNEAGGTKLTEAGSDKRQE